MSIAVPFTFWVNKYAKTLTEKLVTVDDLAVVITSAVAPNKDSQQSLTPGRFGTTALANGCLRYLGNYLGASGCAGDHDAGTMTIDDAAARLDAEGISYIIYSTASHTTRAPRWRVICFFSHELSPNEVGRMVSWLNAILGGCLSKESWTVPIGWKYGNIAGQPDCIIVVGDGEEYIDERDDLDAIALPFQAGKAGKTGPGARPDFAGMDENELRDAVRSGEYGYEPCKYLIELGFEAQIPESDVIADLEALFDAVPLLQRRSKWGQQRANVPRWAKQGYARLTKRRGRAFSAMVDFLQNSPQYKDAIQYDLFTSNVEVATPFPPVPNQTIGDFCPLRDPQHTLECMISLQASGFPKASKSGVFDALYLAAIRNSVHPVREYFGSLQDDGNTRLDRMFFDYIPAQLPNRDEDPEKYDRYVTYLKKIGPCFMIAAVARIFRPGCKVDNLPVLLSPQNYNKSKALAALVKDVRWFTDDVPVNVADKDCKQALDGKLIVELSEFPQIRRDVDHLKAFISRSTDRYRPPYARTVGDWPRQCIFIATVNELELPDVTGNRRYWPVLLAAPVNVEAIERDRDLLWAEAVALFRSGVKWWLTPEVETIATEVQDAFVEHDTRDAVISAWIDSAFPLKDRGGRELSLVERNIRFSVREVLLGAFGLLITPKDNLDGLPVASMADEKRVIRRLRRLGYRPDPHRYRADGRQRFWVPIGT